MKNLMIILILISSVSCQDIENCLTNDEQRVIILRFFDSDDESPKNGNFRITADNSPYEFGFIADTVISAGDTTIVSDSTFIALPLNPETPTTTFFFDADTSFYLELSYETNLSIFDPGCPPSLYFTNIDTVSYSFNAVAIPGTITNRKLGTNVEVYY